MDGLDSEMFHYFKSLLIRGFHELRKHLEDILVIIEILMKGIIYISYITVFVDSKMPCFVKPKLLFDEIRDRISLRYNTGATKESDFFELVDRILKNSANNWRTI